MSARRDFTNLQVRLGGQWRVEGCTFVDSVVRFETVCTLGNNDEWPLQLLSAQLVCRETMTNSDRQREFAIEVVQRLRRSGYQALWAGGCVRDLLLERVPEDYDVATDATPGDVRTVFGKSRTLGVGASFGVIIVRGPRKAGQVEVATFRTEGPYADGRRPDHVTFSSPQADAERRDFTINGMFFDPVRKQVRDYVGGEADLKDGIVRAIGEPRARMSEDKLRMLRAVRFAATLEFALDPKTADAITEMASEIALVSAERIAQELRRMLVDCNRHRAMQLAVDLQLLPVVIPPLSNVIELGTDTALQSDWQRTLDMLKLLEEPRFELTMAALLHAIWSPADGPQPDSIRSVCRGLRFSNHETAIATWLVGHQFALRSAGRLPLYRLKQLLSLPLASDLLRLSRVYALSTDGDLRDVNFCED